MNGGASGLAGLMVAASNRASASAKVVATPCGFGVGFRFTLTITSEGRGTFCNSTFNPNCFSTASKTEMPSGPFAASAPRGVHSRSKSQEPSSFVESITS